MPTTPKIWKSLTQVNATDSGPNGDGQLDDAEIAREVRGAIRNDIAERFTNFRGQLHQLFVRQAPQVLRRLEPRQNFKFH